MHTGAWPAHQIDHINGDKADNRPENLRDIHAVANCQNQHKARRINRSGALGVSQHKSGKFVARIYVDGERVYLGSFDNKADAEAVYSAARKVAHLVVRRPAEAGRAR